MDKEINSMTSKEVQNNFRRQAIRDAYYSEMKSGYFPTINALNPKVNNILGQQIQPFALVDIFKSLGFEYSFNATTNSSELIERPEIRLKRIKYLKTIKKARRTGAPIVYVLVSETIVGGISIVVVVAAIESKVLKESISVAPSEKVTSEVLRYWLQNRLISIIERNSIIVLNESTYEKFVSDVPDYSSSPNTMKTWLEENDIPFGKDYIKPELYEVIKLYKENFFNREFCVKAVLIPDDNPGFNPVDIVWYNMEPYDYKNISDIKIKDTAKVVTIVGMLRKLKLYKLSVSNLNKAITALFGCMSEKIWQSCMKKVIEYEEKIMNIEKSTDESENNIRIDTLDKAPSKVETDATHMETEPINKELNMKPVKTIDKDPSKVETDATHMETEPIIKELNMKPVKNEAETLRNALRNFTCDDD